MDIAAPDEESLAFNAQIKLFRARQSVHQALRSFLDEHNLTEKQYETLQTLHLRGPMSHGDLADKLFCAPGNISAILDNLQDKGLIERRRKEDDRRVVQVQLTPEGERIMDDVFPRYTEKLKETMGVLSEDEIQTLARLCKKLGTGVSAE